MSCNFFNRKKGCTGRKAALAETDVKKKKEKRPSVFLGLFWNERSVGKERGELVLDSVRSGGEEEGVCR